jgi:hypothetical protein
MVSLAARSASRTAWSTVSRSTPGMEGTGTRALSPSMTNSGQIRSSVVSWFSRTMRRAQSLRRLRRRRVGRSRRSLSAAASCTMGVKRVRASMGRPNLIAMGVSWASF